MRSWFRNRKYKSGTGWCFWRWTDVRSEYILRLHVFKTPWFALCLHWINKPDPEPHLHDHPVTFLSLILKGWYWEWRNGPSDSWTWHYHRWFNWVRATPEWAHKIGKVSPGGALTLCFMGPKTREWGYHTSRGWVYWKDYEAKMKAEQAERDAKAQKALVAFKAKLRVVKGDRP